MTISRKTIGVGIIGAGRMGAIRAHLAATNSAVTFLALSDIDPGKAAALAGQTEARFHAEDNRAVIEHPDVDVVIISTPEGAHTEAVCMALEAGKPVLVEKPVALTLEDADRILAVQSRTGIDLYVGYTQRFRRRFLAVKEQIDRGRLGEVLTGRMSIYHSRSDARQMYARSKTVSPFTNSLAYMVDMALWFFAPLRPARVYAVAGSRVFAEHPKGIGDYGWAILTFENGATVNLGVSWILPERWPAYVCSMGIEVFGTKGAITVDDGHKETLLVSSESTPAPDPTLEAVFLGTMMPGDWAVGDFYGPMREETRLFIERVTTGKEVPLCSGETARSVLKITLAMEESAGTGGTVLELL